MIMPIAKRPALVQAPHTPISRRRFINGTAALASGVAAGGGFPSPSWATDPPPQPPPPDHDLRKGVGYITSVKDQDYPVTCNACTAFAVVAAVEGTYNKAGGFPGTQGPDLDELDLFHNAGSGGCATTHWWPKYALDYCQSNGLKWEASSNLPIKISEAKNLLDDNSVNQTQINMKTWIYNYGPVVAVMVQYEDFFLFGDSWFDEHGAMENTHVYAPVKRKRRRSPIVGGHSVAVVGYKGNDYWICKNSWGNTWNGDGYVLIAQGKQGGFLDTCIDRIDVWGVRVRVQP
jgi:hypothetical protein